MELQNYNFFLVSIKFPSHFPKPNPTLLDLLMKVSNRKKIIGVLLAVLLGISVNLSAQGVYIDLELSSNINTSTIVSGDPISITLSLSNNGNSTANNITVNINPVTGDNFSGNSSNISSNTSSYNASPSNTWQILSIPAGATETLILETIANEGLLYFTAEVTAVDEFDFNSIPNNQQTNENDYTFFCWSFPMSICEGETTTLYAPEGYTNYQWFLDGNSIEGNNETLTVNQAGDYNYQALDATGCVLSSPCAFKVNTTVCQTSIECDNNVPLCRSTFYEYPFPSEVCIDFCGNDLEIEDLSTLFNCSLLKTSSNCFNYLPLPLFGGQDTISVVSCNAAGLCDTAYVFLTVSPTCDDAPTGNQAPIAVADYFELDQYIPNLLNVLENDVDPEAGNLEICDFMPSANGHIEIINGQLFYTPNPNFVGNDQFIYTICDEMGSMDVGTINITITGIPCEYTANYCRPTFLTQPSASEICIDFCQDGMSIESVNTTFPCNINNIGQACFSFVPFPYQTGIAEIIIEGCDVLDNCETAYVNIDVSDECGPNTNAPRMITESIALANIITPNGDGINDVLNFGPALIDASEWEIRIFNRLGQVIQTLNSQVNDAFWDGRIYGEYSLNPDTYFYHINIETSFGNIRNRTGFIELRK